MALIDADCKIKVRTPYRDFTDAQKSAAIASKRKYVELNRAAIAKRKNEHYHANRDKYLAIERERNYRKLYGIGIVDYARMFADQNGKCGICGSGQSIKGGRSQYFSVDHCHDTRRVRGLLCLACNHLLGRYERQKEAIEAYLKKGSQ